jgi:hypothetical protein
MTELPPSKARIILKTCVENIVQDILKRLDNAADQFPDVEENTNILVDSVISSTFYKLIMLRVKYLPANEARRYLRDILSNVKDYVNEDITRKLLDDCKE